MVDRHGAPTSTELVRDSMAEYEDNPPPKPVLKKVERRPNTQSARQALLHLQTDEFLFYIITNNLTRVFEQNHMPCSYFVCTGISAGWCSG